MLDRKDEEILRTTKEFYAHRPNIGGLEESRVRKCIELFTQFKGDRILDIGCADGTIILRLMQVMGAKEAFGIDIADDAVAAAKEKGVKAFCLDLDRQELPFDNDYFDAIYCGEVIEHLFNPDHLLNEARRVLKAGGICVLTTPNLAGWANRLGLILGFQPFPMSVSPDHEAVGKMLLKGEEGQWGHIRVFMLRALKQLVGLHGFTVNCVKGCPVTVKSASKWTPLIELCDKSLARFPGLANRVILIAKKKT